MENFGKTRQASFMFDNSLNKMSLNKLQLNGSASGYDIKSSGVKSFSRNVQSDYCRPLPQLKSKKNDESYHFNVANKTVETKRVERKKNENENEDYEQPKLEEVPIRQHEKNERVVRKTNEKENRSIKNYSNKDNDGANDESDNNDRKKNEKEKSIKQNSSAKQKNVVEEDDNLDNNESDEDMQRLPKPKKINDDAFKKPLKKSENVKIIDDLKNDSENEENGKENKNDNSNVLIIPDLKREISQDSNNIFIKYTEYLLQYESTLNQMHSTLNHSLLNIEPESMLKTCIKRSTGRLPIYTMYLEKSDGTFQKILIAHTVKKLPKTYIKIYALVQSDLKKNILLGKLKANLSNNHFTLYNYMNISETLADENDDKDGSELTEEQLNIIYTDASIFSTNKVQQFTLYLSKNRKLGVRSSVSRHVSNNNQSNILFDTFLNRYSFTNEINTTEFISKMPKFNEKKGTYTLNFSGRVSETSAHNCQIVTKKDTAKINLQFGKIGKNTFNCDFSHPFNAFQAFGFALSNLCR